MASIGATRRFSHGHVLQRRMVGPWFLLGFLSLCLYGVQSFLPGTPLLARKTACYSSEGDDLEDMRKLLEASWNSETMGTIPTNPEVAAVEAATAVRNAMDNGQSLFFVDLLLPSYDISQGPHMYDDVLAVEFCIALTNALDEKASILVRDEKSLNDVRKVIDARERNREMDGDDDGDEDEDDFEIEEEEEENNDDAIEDEQDNIEYYDDFADLGLGDVDAFREQLTETWDNPTAEKEACAEKSGSEMGAESPSSNADSTSKKAAKQKPVSARMDTGRLYRLASLFGDAKIPTGADMMDQAVKAVAAHGQPRDDEKMIIVLSAITREEMIAVRSLAAKHKTSKTIVLVNCQIDPIPRELIRANTVYSILPLVAKPVVSEQNIFGSEQAKPEVETPPKVVIMRRYPRDWEVFVDADGSGFELADVAQASQVGKKGPPMEWIANCVKRHLQSKFG